MANKEKIKVAVHGAAGRVGQEVISAVDNAADLDLTCAIDKISEYQSNVQVPYYNNVHLSLIHI